jgi:hypothetical protein
MPKYFGWSKQYEYMLFAADYDYQQKWARSVPVLVRAMVKSGDQLHIFGPREIRKQEDLFKTIVSEETQKVMAKQDAAIRGGRGALLLHVNASDGTIVSGHKLPTTPVFDGLASVEGRLYVALSDGTVTCLGEEGTPLESIEPSEISEYNANSDLRPDRARNRAAAKKPKR